VITMLRTRLGHDLWALALLQKPPWPTVRTSPLRSSAPMRFGELSERSLMGVASGDRHEPRGRRVRLRGRWLAEGVKDHLSGVRVERDELSGDTRSRRGAPSTRTSSCSSNLARPPSSRPTASS